MQDNSPNEKASAVEAIFSGALILSAAERAAFLAEKCGKDFQLRARVEALLRAHEKAEGFLPEQARGSLEPTVMQRGTPVLPAIEQPGDRIGRYKLLQQIGEGGCGVVYMAEQVEPVRRRVALKVVKLGMDTKSVIARFEAERQALALMDHPNIAKVLDAGATQTGRPYFVMELVRGVKITDYCDEKKLPTRQRLDLFVQVCQAIQHAHQKGIIHRDIKPSNIIVTINDGVAVPKVIDFGIAKATGGQQLTDKTIFTAFEQFIGTPAYMSPEQAELTSVDIDTRSDIYALGVLLYELLTGKTPFDSKALLAIGLDELRRTIREQEPERPSTRLSTLPDKELSTAAQRRGIEAPKLLSELRGDLDWIAMRCIEKDRAYRYETANGLAMDIERYLHHQPIVARPPSPVYRFQKMVRRNRVAFAAGTTVVAALMIGFGVSTWMYLRERAARRDQVRLRELVEAGEKEARLEVVRGQAATMASLMTSSMAARRYSDVDHALERMLTPEQATNAMNAPLLVVRANFLARRGRLREAASDFARLLEFDPGDYDHWHTLAPLLAQTGDLDDYREHCRKSVERFGITKDPNTAHRIAKDCSILPPWDVNLETLNRLADHSLTVGTNFLFWPAFASTKALVEYRQGQFASAMEWAANFLARLPSFKILPEYRSCFEVQTYAVQGMGHYRLGQDVPARASLLTAQEISDRLPNLESGDLGTAWGDLLIAHALLREAKALIQGTAETTPKTK
jgi:serine/threonine protein kinase